VFETESIKYTHTNSIRHQQYHAEYHDTSFAACGQKLVNIMAKKDKKRVADATQDEWHVTCDLDGDMLVRELTFSYAAEQWNPREET